MLPKLEGRVVHRAFVLSIPRVFNHWATRKVEGCIVLKGVPVEKNGVGA